ncbi:NAD-dependent epimerase/dehydratase family protein [Ruminococcus champanellensis]|uniref:NAD-dependent epimerase/dehydratase family protein n=1 Tax=Ruminococcus champanellensis TaxID=1161942 RepID=UPI0039F49A78
MATVLVTGACGLIGEKVCSGLLKKHHEVIAVDHAPSAYNEGKEHYRFYAAAPHDKTTYMGIFEKERIDAVVHLACSVDNDLGPIITEKQMEESHVCDKFLFKLAISKEVEKIMVLSTTQVYAIPEGREPIREGDDEKPVTNYAKMKSETEHAFAADMRHIKNVIGCIMRVPPVYTLEMHDNLLAKITDPKDHTNFVYRTGEYGFHFCCVHNLADFILCYLRQADSPSCTGVYNVADKNLIMASEIVNFISKNGRLGPVLQRNPGKDILSSIFKFKNNKEEKTNYRYLDFSTITRNTMYDTNKASRYCPFRWDLSNTK